MICEKCGQETDPKGRFCGGALTVRPQNPLPSRKVFHQQINHEMVRICEQEGHARFHKSVHSVEVRALANVVYRYLKKSNH